MKSFMIFLSGVIVGAGGTYFFLKDRFNQMTKEEIDSVKSVFEKQFQKDREAEQANDISKKEGYSEVDHEEDSASYEKDDLSSYRIKHEVNYSNMNEVKISEEEPENLYPVEEDFEEQPFVISPSVFDSRSSHEQATLTYYSRQGILCSGSGYEVNVHDTIGEEALKHFGDFEPNTVYVRNNRLGYDYEVLLDEISEFTD